jgi:flagellar hook-associated protein 2
MSGITSGIGLFSGIDTQSLIDQLLSVSARPRALAEQRLVQLQVRQSAYLAINTSLNALKNASSVFRTSSVFDAKSVTVSDPTLLTASADKNAVAGNYNFIVDRLVSTQQYLSRGFADLDVSGLNAGSWSFESVDARLDRDVSLSALNGGAGVSRGTIIVRDSDGDEATIDLSRAGTVNEVLDAINNSTAIDVTARVEDGKFVLDGATTVTSGTGFSTAESLGLDASSANLVGGELVGATVYGLGSTTSLASLNDGNGVNFGNDVGENRYDFIINVDMDGAGGDDAIEVRVNIGSEWAFEDDELVETATRVTTVGGVVDRINAALTAATGVSGVSASIDASNGRIVLSAGGGVDLEVTEKVTGASGQATTARDLGLLGSGTGGLNGDRVLAGLNTTLMRNLNGGAGLSGDALDFTLRSGDALSISGLSGASTFAEMVSLINDDATNAGRIVASLNDTGTGITLTDTTGGANNLIIGGSAAAELGVETDVAGVAANSVRGEDLEHRYISESTLVGSLNGGKGIGEGKFRITDANGTIAEITVDESVQTLGHLIKRINDASIGVTARINDTGDGLLIEEEVPGGGSPGAVKIKIEDVTGSVAKGLRLAKEADDTGADNVLDGSYETTLEFEATDTLSDILKKINDSGAGVRASVINDGAGVNPYRLSISSNQSGTAGRFVLDSGDFDLALDSLDEGQDARVFFGSSDAARGVLLTSSTNTLDGVVTGVTINLKAASEEPVSITVTQDSESIESRITQMVDAFNSLVTRIGSSTQYVEETNQRGPLLGDGTTIALRNALFNEILGKNQGFGGTFDDLTDVGLSVGSGGKLAFDKETFRNAMEQDAAAVEDLFTRRTVDPDGNTIDLGDGITGRDPDAPTRYSELGVIPRIEQFIETYISSVDGVLTRKNESLNSQIALQRSRIESINKRLESKRDILTRQFIAMEQAIGQLQSQQGSLSSIQRIG